MHSFTDINGTVIPFEIKHELELEEQQDIVSGKITAYLVRKDEMIYTVDQKTYEAIERM